MEPNPKDTQILQYMRTNARENLTTISRKTGIPVSTIFDRLKSSQGIKRFTALLDFAQLGYPVRTNLLLKVAPENRVAIRGYLLAHANVNSILRINNGFDFALDCVFKTIKEAEDFVEDLELRFQVLDKQLFHVIDEIAIEKALVETQL